MSEVELVVLDLLGGVTILLIELAIGQQHQIGGIVVEYHLVDLAEIEDKVDIHVFEEERGHF